MESVIVGRNVRTWSVKFGSSRTKLVPLGMGMCLNSQMLELINWTFPFIQFGLFYQLVSVELALQYQFFL